MKKIVEDLSLSYNTQLTPDLIKKALKVKLLMEELTNLVCFPDEDDLR
jgi:hypothetical protein